MQDLMFANFRLERITDEDLKKAEDFTKLMSVMYTSTLCVSSDSTPTCGQVLPIFQKLEEHFQVQENDTLFVAGMKKKVWEDLSKQYQVQQTVKYTTQLQSYHLLFHDDIHDIPSTDYCLVLQYRLQITCFEFIILKNEDIRHFLEEATVMDPRFKNKLLADNIWERVKLAAVMAQNKVLLRYFHTHTHTHIGNNVYCL